MVKLKKKTINEINRESEFYVEKEKPIVVAKSKSVVSSMGISAWRDKLNWDKHGLKEVFDKDVSICNDQTSHEPKKSKLPTKDCHFWDSNDISAFDRTEITKYVESGLNQYSESVKSPLRFERQTQKPKEPFYILEPIGECLNVRKTHLPSEDYFKNVAEKKFVGILKSKDTIYLTSDKYKDSNGKTAKELLESAKCVTGQTYEIQGMLKKKGFNYDKEKRKFNR